MNTKNVPQNTIIQEGAVRKGNITDGPMTEKPPMAIQGFSPQGSGNEQKPISQTPPSDEGNRSNP
jgi:hypothetical protein